MNKFIVHLPNLQHKSGVLFNGEDKNKKYKFFLDKLNSSYEVKKFNGGGSSYNAIDIKNFLHKIKESFESEFQNLDSYHYDDLKSSFRIIVPYQIHREILINKLNTDFEFKGCCVLKTDIITNQ